MSINVQNANAYFEGRTTLGKYWREFSGEQKDAAILQARCDLSKILHRPLNDDEPPYAEGMEIREEFAVYWQALYTLLRDTLPEGSGEAVPSLEEEKRPSAFRLEGVSGKWSRRALEWLGVRVVPVATN